MPMNFSGRILRGIAVVREAEGAIMRITPVTMMVTMMMTIIPLMMETPLVTIAQTARAMVIQTIQTMALASIITVPIRLDVSSGAPTRLLLAVVTGQCGFIALPVPVPMRVPVATVVVGEAVGMADHREITWVPRRTIFREKFVFICRVA
jgi:hypothetical protein